MFQIQWSPLDHEQDENELNAKDRSKSHKNELKAKDTNKQDENELKVKTQTNKRKIN